MLQPRGPIFMVFDYRRALRRSVSCFAALVAVSAFGGCVQSSEGEDAVDDEDAPAAEQELVAGSSDRYSCFTSRRSGCDANVGIHKSLEDAAECKEGVDFTVKTKNDRPKQPVILAFHGGRIEFGTAEIASYLTGALGWDHYTLQASPKSTTCKEPRWMHVTSNRFNAPVAVDMAKQHPSAVSLHGYSEDNKERPWARESKIYVCVGGLNADARSNFIRSLNTPAITVGKQTVEAFDASRASDDTREICGGLQGYGPTNVVNQSPAKGIQLEMPALLRAELVGSGGHRLNTKLRERFKTAVEDAFEK